MLCEHRHVPLQSYSRSCVTCAPTNSGSVCGVSCRFLQMTCGKRTQRTRLRPCRLRSLRGRSAWARSMCDAATWVSGRHAHECRSLAGSAAQPQRRRPPRPRGLSAWAPHARGAAPAPACAARAGCTASTGAPRPARCVCVSRQHVRVAGHGKGLVTSRTLDGLPGTHDQRAHRVSARGRLCACALWQGRYGRVLVLVKLE